MTPEENPDYLQHLNEWVTEFQSKFEEFLTLHVENTGINAIALGVAPAVIPKDGSDPERIRVLAGELNVLAGRAKDACPITRMTYVVQGAGTIDPIVSWESVTRPKPLLEPQDVLGLCNQVRGRLKGMIERAKALEAPATDTSRMHPLIWSAARSLWASGHPKQAIAAAAEALIGQVKARLDRNDIPETALWQEAFSNKPPEAGKPRLRWPGDPTHRDVTSMQEGLRQFAPGAQLLIRNPAAHGTDLTEQQAFERLAVLSLLASLVDECETVQANDE